MTRAVTTGSTVGSLLALSVLLRAMFPGVAIPSVPANPPAATSTTFVPAPAETTSDEGPWKASQRFFAGGVPPCDETSGAPPTRTGRWCIPNDTSALAFIAIAPDPVRTHMALQFDRALEAIELAAGSAGYVISQYWLPWSVESPKSSDAAGKSQPDPTPQQRDDRAAQPGLVLLRRDAGPTSTDPKLLYVFLVADTATTGIDGKQFANAVDYLEEVCALATVAVGCKPGDPIRIVGPTFSGSLASLRRLTRREARAAVHRRTAGPFRVRARWPTRDSRRRRVRRAKDQPRHRTSFRCGRSCSAPNWRSRGSSKRCNTATPSPTPVARRRSRFCPKGPRRLARSRRPARLLAASRTSCSLARSPISETRRGRPALARPAQRQTRARPGRSCSST